MDLPLKFFRFVTFIFFYLINFPNQVLFYGYKLRYLQDLSIIVYEFRLNLIC